MTAMQGEVSLQGYRTRLDAAFASNAPRAVILRRGPKKHFHLISWDLRNDTFIHGQWMKGVVRLCDLSPSGNKLLYWAAQHHNSAAERARRRPSVTGEEQEGSPRFEPLAQRGRDMAEFAKRHPKRRVPRYLRAPDGKSQGKSAPRADTGTWTAISRPPYFSALAVWPSFGTWTGGGYFRSDNEVVLFESDEGMVPQENVRRPAVFKMSPYFTNRTFCNAELAARAEGYPIKKEAGEAIVNGLAGSDKPKRWVDWIHADRASGILYFAVDGAVYRLANWAGLDPVEYLTAATKIADFNGLSFQQMRAPAEAMRWT